MRRLKSKRLSASGIFMVRLSRGGGRDWYVVGCGLRSDSVARSGRFCFSKSSSGVTGSTSYLRCRSGKSI